MKRRISLVIAFALSFLMMFGSLARAEEMKVKITVTLPESAELEVVKVLPIETKKTTYTLPQEKISDRVLEQEELLEIMGCSAADQWCNIGYYMKPALNGYYCLQCAGFSIK